MIRNNYNHTIAACYIGYIIQAIVNNFAALLFVTFGSVYGISLGKITILITINFGVQLAVDLVSAKIVDKIGYRRCIVAAQFFAAAGLGGLGLLPELFSDPFVGIAICVVTYAVGGGLLEVLISPIVEACPTKNKEASMSLLHSFYCWGQVLVVIVSTAFFSIFGMENWRIMAFVWAVIPFCNGWYFMVVPIKKTVETGNSMPIRKLLSTKLFWLLFVLMLSAGASELAMSQWASAFAELGLKVSKSMGDLMGPCMFGLLMGISRVLYSKLSDKIPLKSYMMVSAAICIVSYLLASLSPNPVLSLVGCGLCGLAVGVMWPGTFSLAAKECPTGGTAMFALLALSGDLGCSSGPTAIGLISDSLGGDLKKGLIFGVAFPMIMMFGLVISKVIKKA